MGADPPQLDCCDLLSEIKGTEHTQNIRVVMLSPGGTAERSRASISAPTMFSPCPSTHMNCCRGCAPSCEINPLRTSLESSSALLRKIETLPSRWRAGRLKIANPVPPSRAIYKSTYTSTSAVCAIGRLYSLPTTGEHSCELASFRSIWSTTGTLDRRLTQLSMETSSLHNLTESVVTFFEELHQYGRMRLRFQHMRLPFER